MISSTQTDDPKLNAPAKVLGILQQSAEEESLVGMVFVLDTLKKFLKVMSKDDAPAFFHLLRRLNAKGATVILLGHANKNEELDGSVIFEGVQDIQNDIDVMFSIRSLTERTETTQESLIECLKDRGPVAQSLGFQYKKGMLYDYQEMLDSVTFLDQDLLEEAKKKARLNDVKAKHEEEAGYLAAHLTYEWVYLKDLIAMLKDGDNNPNGVTDRRLRAAVHDLAGVGWLCKRVLKAENNAIQLKKRSER